VHVWMLVSLRRLRSGSAAATTFRQLHWVLVSLYHGV
jgi:hypothetical protein